MGRLHYAPDYFMGRFRHFVTYSGRNRLPPLSPRRLLVRDGHNERVNGLAGEQGTFHLEWDARIRMNTHPVNARVSSSPTTRTRATARQAPRRRWTDEGTNIPTCQLDPIGGGGGRGAATANEL